MELSASQKYLKQVRQVTEQLSRQIPKKVQMEGNRSGLIQELVGINARKAQLCAWFEDPDREGHLRMLGGVDPSQSELWIILGRLERRLAAKEEDLIEKNLIYEAIGRLVDSLKVTTDAKKTCTIRNVQDVNQIQHKLVDLRKQLKTVHAELIISSNEHNVLKSELKVGIDTLHTNHLETRKATRPVHDKDAE
ncbi:unnamed protein product [Rodentolepis nana]|uniref:Coiled-coil domain-containing protein 142 n=1 Tax=Rodentolepis nana TaxID=102285 RepID=A0A0R3TFJ5_RODNA|nr:unnamed protein product [Rodentolepis nana]